MSNGTSTLRAVSPFDVAHTAIWYRSQMAFLLFCFSSFPAITLILSSIQQCVNLPQPRISCCSVFFCWFFFFLSEGSAFSLQYNGDLQTLEVFGCGVFSQTLLSREVAVVHKNAIQESGLSGGKMSKQDQ